ncbi:MAG: RNA methyltransferase [Desulfatibacillum sp.]|nr:RNA methyltransferase [Desulfatibacillum sp.]
MPHSVDFNNVAIVLCQPQIPQNIGGVARAMANMGLSRLIVVDPKNLDMEKIYPMATMGARHLIESMEVVDDLQTALKEFNYVVGTTARMGSHRKAITLENMAVKLISLSKENKVALVFGREDRGLSTEDVRLCHQLVNIRTAGFSSLNLAQAVLIVCYEVFKATQDTPKENIPRLANRYDLDAMYEQLSDLLVRVNFINPENPEHWMDNVRRFFSRHPLTARDAKIVRGICRQVDWYTERRFSKSESEQD